MKRLFFNGTIITMTGQPAEAVLTQDGTIVAAGALDALGCTDAARYDLQGQTLLPAFLDAHSHLSSYAASFLQVSLAGADRVEAIQSRLSDWIEQQPPGDTGWVIATAYDDSLLPPDERLDRAALDAVSRAHPIVVQHQSGHSGVWNSTAAALLGLHARTGQLAERDHMAALQRIPLPSVTVLGERCVQAQRRYLAHGIVHVQEGLLVGSLLPLYQHLIEHDLLLLDTVVYPDMQTFDACKARFPQAIGRYHRHMRIGGIKIMLDGSPQSRTAWVRTPYRGTNDCGRSTLSDAAVCAAIRKALVEQVQLLAHCNGDQAIEQFLRALEQFDRAAIRQLRPVLIHAQLLRADQLDRVKALGAIPSFFIGHIYHFGDTHIEQLGLARASRISPARAALDKGIRFTFHQDTPVIAPDVLETLWCATCRRTKSGIVLGAQERIGCLDAIRAQTSNVAAQYGEQRHKGSIAPGKRADLVVLGGDILRTDPDRLRTLPLTNVFCSTVPRSD